MREKCSKFSECEAPFCPITKGSLEFGVWYPDEPICTSKKYGGQDWIKRQRKIARRTKDVTKYFLFEMLEKSCRISPGIVGLDPEKEEEAQLQRWLKKHPPKRELTVEEKIQFRERMKEVLAQK